MGSVAENAAISTVVYTAVATDEDGGDTLSYSLSGTDAASFDMNATSGVVTLKASADFETQSSYSMDVTATDSGNLMATKAVTINVADIYEAPIINPEARFTVNGTLSGLKTGESARMVASSQSLGISRVTLLQGDGGHISFTIDDLPPASDYRIQVQSDNNPDGYWGGVLEEEASGSVGWFGATKINLTQNDIMGVHFQLATGYHLTVTITDVNVDDLFEVTAWSATKNGFDWKRTSATGTRFQVVLSGLPAADDYIVSIESPTDGVRGGFYTGERQPLGPFLKAARISLTSDQSITATTANGYSISGTLSNLMDGNSAWVEAWSKETFEQGLVKVMVDGVYTIKGLASAQDYEVCVESNKQAGGCYAGSDTGLTRRHLAMPVDLRHGTKEGIDLALDKENRTITGKVSGLAKGEMAWVEAWSAWTNHWTVTQVRTDSTFELTGLQKAGDYQVTVEAEGYQNPTPVPVSLINNTASIANFNLSKGGSIQGIIMGLVAGNVVTVEVRSSKLKDSRKTTLAASSSAALLYTVEGLADTDDYVAMLRTAKGNFFYDETIDETTAAQRSRKSATTIEISGGSNKNGIDFFNIASAVSYTLSGTITGLTETDGNLVVTLTAWAKEDGFGSTRRIGNGPWSISGLPARNYHLSISVPRYVDQVYSGNEDGSIPNWSTQQGQGTTVTLSADISGLEVNLSPGYTLTGILTNPTGTAVSGIYVNAWDSVQDVGGGVTTRVDGSFEMTGLQEGLYTVEAIADAGRIKKTLTLNQDKDLGTLTLVKAAGTVRGSTTAGSMVFVYNAVGVFVGATVSDSSGAYQIDGLEVDITYKVDVDKDGDFSNMEFTGNATLTTAVPEVMLNLP